MGWASIHTPPWRGIQQHLPQPDDDLFSSIIPIARPCHLMYKVTTSISLAKI